MKSERRHELQSNLLGQKLQQIGDFLKKYGNYIAWAVVIIALAAFIVTFVHKKQVSKKIEAQRNYDELMSNQTRTPDERLAGLTELAANESNRTIAALANIAVADEYARRAIAAGSDVQDSQRKEYLEKSASHYENVINNFSDEKVAVAQAHFGLGKLAEDQRDFEKAAAQYNKAMQAVPENNPVWKTAEQALNGLDRLKQPVKMATTSSMPSTQPTTQAIATQPATAEADTKPAADEGQ